MFKIILLFSTVLFLVLFMAIEQENFLLTEEDLLLQDTKLNEPAIYVPKKNTYSYNKWDCFLSSQVQIGKSRVNYDGWHDVPSLDVETQSKKRSYDLDPDERWEYEFIKKQWKQLFENESHICILGAYLQDLEDRNELWYIEQIKTEKGYWKREDF